MIAFLILYALVFVNGFSDAPNSIASAVSSGAMKKKQAVAVASVAEAAGVLIFSLLFPSVAYTCSEIAEFSSNESAAILSGMLSALLFALLASSFGIPTSESYAMASAISGGAFFSGGRVSPRAWLMIAVGFFVFSGAAFVFSFVLRRIVRHFFAEGREGFLFASQRIFCAVSAFMHGAQDGQKFIGLAMLFCGASEVPLSAVLICALLLSLGTCFCSERIIERTAFEAVRLDMYGGFSADAVSAALMLSGSLLGIPLSTSSVKNSAMVGAQILTGRGRTDKKSIALMVTVWLLTFPICFLLGGVFFILMK